MSSFNDCEALRLKFQRDLNCLADHDRMVRRKGMQRLKATLQDQKTFKPNQEILENNKREVSAVFFNKYLRDILVRSFSDETEFCRETSMKLVLMFASDILTNKELSLLIEKCIPSLVERVGVSPTPETTEEIRFLAVQLLDLFVKQSEALSDVLKNDKSDIGTGISTILVRSLGDLYPEVKRLCSMTIRHLVSNFSSLASNYGVGLLTGLVSNLTHQHSKTRQLALQALGQMVVCCAGPASGPSSQGEFSDSNQLKGDLAAAAEAASGAQEMSDASEFSDPTDNEAALAKCLKEVVLPALHKVVDDASASVRLTFARCTGFLLRARPLKTTGLHLLGLEAPILSHLLALTNDTADEVQRASFEALIQAANHWAEHTPGWEAGAVASPLPPRNQFVCSPEVAAVEQSTYESLMVMAMVTSHSKMLLPPLLEATASWTVRGRVRALDTLSTVGLLCRGSVVAFVSNLHHYVTNVARCLCDDEEEVVSAARRCAAALGSGACAQEAIELSLPRARGEGEGMDTAQARTAGLMVTAALLEGCATCTSSAVTPNVCSSLSSSGLLLQGWDSELGIMDRNLAAALLQCCDVVVRRGCGEGGFFEINKQADTEQAKQILLALAYLSGLPTEAVNEATQEEAAACALSLSKCLFPRSENSLASLYTVHLPALLDQILAPQCCIAGMHQASESERVGSGGLLWENKDPSRRAFDALLRGATSALGPSLDTVVAVLTAHVTMDCNPDLKLSMLCLLEALLEFSPSHWPPLVVKLVNDALMHNMVWKAGRVASTVRKVAIASFYSCLHRGYADRQTLFKIAPPLLPVLKTDLDDYDASTRELVCLSLDLMFRALPGALSEQPVLELYPALLKRLDDSSDLVRFAVCGCFLSFLRSAPPSAFAGTTIDYTLDQLLVHLDDVDPAIQVPVHYIFLQQ
jgi:hypothetical protein